MTGYILGHCPVCGRDIICEPTGEETDGPLRIASYRASHLHDDGAVVIVSMRIVREEDERWTTT